MTQSNAFVLKSIEVKNWKTFTEATLNVENQGLTGIVGQNGSGKSSFVDAILWCLFGYQPKDVNKASLRRRKSDPTKDETRVRVTFTHAGQTIEVFREMKTKRHTVTAGVFLDGKEVVVATGGTTEDWVTKRLGMDAEGFRT
ncbi:MAG: AAA family ATPase, partial [Enterococcus sp.]|nr:AAA family ATPase [Enterococcus sp.]